MDIMNPMNLDHPVYKQTYKIRGYIGVVDMFGIHDPKQVAKLLIQHMPDLTKSLAEALHNLHSAAVREQEGIWEYISNVAAVATWGRPWRLTDYKISGVGSSEFSGQFKTILRDAAHAQSKHAKLMAAYFEVMRILNRNSAK